MTTMRKQFHERLDQLAARLDDMVVLVENAMRDATTALFTGDTGVAKSVLDGHDEQPVAGALRAIVACLRMSVDLRRMGKLAAHIAEIARDREPNIPVPAPLWEAVRAMSDRALALVAEAARAVSMRDVAAVARLDHDDDQVDRLQQDLYRRLLAGTPGLRPEVVVDLALIGRYCERFADHAVDLGRGIGYLKGRNTLDALMGTR